MPGTQTDLVRGSSFLVTGGAGFIGSHLVEALLEAGARRIVVLDNLRTGSWANTPGDARVERMSADLGTISEDDLRDALGKVDFLFHLAAEKHNQSVDMPDRVLEVNVNGTFRLFRAAAAAQVKKVVFTSSLYATGRLTLPPMTEEDLPQPRTVYGTSKLTGEHLLRYFALSAGLRSTSFRLFFVYGPKQFSGTGYKSVIVANFERILRGESPVVVGDGRQSLDYTHVSDVARALILGLAEAADGQVINIGQGAAISVADLTTLMLDVAGSSLQPVYAPPDWTAGSHRECRNDKARELLGWQPAIGLRDGLAGVWSWMKSR
jgi:UDP-glucose 4-epimerase